MDELLNKYWMDEWLTGIKTNLEWMNGWMNGINKQI